MRNHRLLVDQPERDGGDDRAPTELFVGSHCTVHDSITTEPDITIPAE